MIVNSINTGASNSLNMESYKNPVCEKEDCIGVEESIGNITADVAVIAHRGASIEAPENTLPAFILAAQKGYTTVECDISWTKDSVPVLLHDSTINRTARKENGWGFIFSKKCSNYTFEELKELDFGSWKSKEYIGTRIPSFEEALKCCEEYGLNLYVELKKTDDFNIEKAKILSELVKQSGLEEKVTWISFNSDYLKTMSELMPNSRLGYLSENEPDEKTIEIINSLKTGNNEVFLNIDAFEMNKQADLMLDEAGIDFEAWNVDDEKILEKMISYDCDGITTDIFTQNEVNEFIDLYDE